MFRHFGRYLGLVLVLFAGIATAQPPKAPPAGKPEPKGTEVIINNIRAVTPPTWKPEKPANRLRSHQFKLPNAAGDKEEAEVYVLPEVGGKIDENFGRLKELFIAPPDMPKNEAVKQSEFKVGNATVHVLELHGTFHVRHIPVERAVKEVRPDYAMIAVVWKSEMVNCSIRLVGPRKTVAAHAAEFAKWVKSFR